VKLKGAPFFSLGAVLFQGFRAARKMCQSNGGLAVDDQSSHVNMSKTGSDNRSEPLRRVDHARVSAHVDERSSMRLEVTTPITGAIQLFCRARQSCSIKRLPYLVGVVFWLLGSVGAANAAHVDIVAVGESNTEGYGVGTTAAYPAVLERLLRAKGYDVTIANAGVSGNSSSMILGRIDSAVPVGTQIVILQMGYYNDSIYGVSLAENQANINSVIAHVRARGAKVIFVDSSVFATIPRNYYQRDGLHLTEEGQAMMAAKLLPQVVKALGGR
jgi:acyl-CoA thioesterase I